MRLYGNRDIAGTGPSSYDSFISADRVTLNVIKSACDTLTSRIGKNRPRPTFLTNDGNFSLRKRAKLLQRYVEGMFYSAKVYQTAPKVFLDSLVFDAGIGKVFRQPGTQKIVFERVFPTELYVDPIEGFYGEPQQIIQSKFVNRDIVLEAFPEHSFDILQASNDISSYEEGEFGVDSTADQVRLLEAWHLPSGPEAKDGKHIIVLGDIILFEEEWTKDYFPFVVIKWSERLRGFWGAGIAEELIGIQTEINALLSKTQKIMDLVSVPRVFVEQGSKINKAKINNQIGAIVPYTGAPPIIAATSGVPVEIFGQTDRLYQRAFEIIGLSQLSASSQKPAGLESGIALRTFNDIESERFAIVSRNYEQMFLDIATRIVDIGRDIASEDPGYSVVAEKDKYTIQQVTWSEVDLDRDSYVLKVYPASSLPNTPSGKLAFVENMIALQLVDVEEGKRLLDFPDLERSVALERSMSDNIDRSIEQMLDEGLYEGPSPFIDHALALKKTQSELLKAQNDDAPEERLELLRQFMLACNQKILESQQQQMMQSQALQMGLQQAAPLPGAPPAPGVQGVPPQAV
jgi:hypothetical protein